MSEDSIPPMMPATMLMKTHVFKRPTIVTSASGGKWRRGFSKTNNRGHAKLKPQDLVRLKK
jgi:hypothetical protein